MANIKFSRKVFEKEIGKLDEKMQNKIALFGTTLESFNKDEIELEIFPNRPDLLSYSGFKRSFLCFLEKQKGIKNYKINSPEKDYSVLIDNSVKDVRPYTACAIIKGLKLNDERIKEIIDLQEKLHNTVGRKRKKVAIGIYPLEKIKLPIFYKALEPDKIRFIPLEAPREMSGLEILQKHPTGRDYALLLAGKSKFPVFMDSDKNILSMPPIINSERTGRVDEKTKNVFVECSGFDLEILNKCLVILTSALAEMGGKIYSMEIKDTKKRISPNFSTEKLKISLEKSNKLLGLELGEKEVKGLFEKMGLNYSKGIVEIPAWRTDILHEVDLMEDLAIAYGYENFEPEIPEISTIGNPDSREIIKKKIAEILIGLNLLEISNYHLIPKEDAFKKMGLDDKNAIELAEAKSEYNVLRNNLTSYLLKIFSENVDSEYPQRIFELGKVFDLDGAGKIFESERLCVGISPGNFTEIRQILDYLGRMLGIKFEIAESKESLFHFVEGRSADIFLKGKKIGSLGEVHPRTLRIWKIKMPIAMLEIELKNIFEFLK
jgi:phenylalanyl-tRNA synthetase beta chain